jgi:hypothetical protein
MSKLEEGSIKTGSQPPYCPPNVVRMGDVSGGAGDCTATGTVNSSGSCFAGTTNTGGGTCTAGGTNSGFGCIAGGTVFSGACTDGTSYT